MKKLLSVLFTLFITNTSYSESIYLYEIDTVIREDSTFLITEKIHYDFEGAKRHGIYRTIPIRLKRPTDTGFGTLNANYSVHVNVLKVTDENEKERPFKLAHSGGDLKIRIGSPHKKVTGRQVYEITYKVERAINEFKETDEFYWNFIGQAWNVPIQKTNVNIFFKKTPPDSIKIKNFSGYYGSTNELKGMLNESNYTFSSGPLRPKEGISTVISMEKGYLKLPSKATKLKWFVQDNLGPVWAVSFPLCVAILFFFLHKWYGRDPDRDLPIMVRYTPPDNMTPAEVGTLIDESADPDDIVATVFSLGSKGYVEITETESKGFLNFSTSNYTFELVKDPDESLTPYERLFIDSLFSGSKKISLNQLRNSFYRKIPRLSKSLYDGLVGKRFFNMNPAKVKALYLVAGFLAVFAINIAVIFKLHQNGYGDQASWVLLGGFLAVVVVVFASKYMPRKTKQGAKALRDILGLKEFIERVESDRLRRMYDEDHTLFDRILPFAIVLGCADEWADKFASMTIEPPTWYRSSSRSGVFSTSTLVSSMGKSMNSMTKTFVSQPKSSGSGGGSGFSSGGGISGGGFGGGGGGSW